MTGMAYIKLSNGGFAVVDEDLLDTLQLFRWRKNPKGYAVWRCGFKGKQFSVPMHRWVNDTDVGKQTDHINGDKLDNRRCNLRSATGWQNSVNCKAKKHKNSTSRFKGVIRRNNTTDKVWEAYIRIKGRVTSLGCYATQEEAALAYNEAARRAFGDFAHPNKVN